MEPTTKPRSEWQPGDVVLLRDGLPHPQGAPHVVYTYACDDCKTPIGVCAFHLLAPPANPLHPRTGHYCRACKGARQEAERAEQERQRQAEAEERARAAHRDALLDRLARLSPEALERVIALAEKP